MKAISVRQPWAFLLCAGVKTIEVRTWKTPYRGDLLICVSASPKNVFLKDPGEKELQLLPAGCFMGIVELLDVRPMKKSDDKASCYCYADGSYAWVTRPKRMVKPDKFSGRLSLYDVPDDKIVLLDQNASAFATFDYPPPQGDVKYKESCPLVELKAA